MPASLLAAIPTTQVIASGKDHQPIFKVIVLTFHERFWLIILVHTEKHLCFRCFLWLKNEARPGPASPSRRSKAALEIFPIEQVIDVPKEPQLPPIITQGQRIARTQIRFREPLESIPSTRKSDGIENGADVIARRGKIEIDQHAATDMLSRHDRELMLWNHERANRPRHLRRALLRFGERVCSREVQRPNRSCS